MRSSSPTLFCAPLFLLCLSGPIEAQTVGGKWETPFRFDGPHPLATFGGAVGGAGDMDLDGFPDLVIGGIGTAPGGLVDAGSAWAFSGATGSLLWRFDGGAAGDWLGYSVAGAGDVDGDGHGDLVVGAINAWGNGFSEAGQALVFSGLSGSLVWRFEGPSSGARLGVSVAGAGDVDGDGLDDLIVGAPRNRIGTLQDAGSAFVFSGGTGSVILQVDGSPGVLAVGQAVCGLGDVDGDGVPDLAIGAPSSNGTNGRIQAGLVRLHSGVDASLIWEYSGAWMHAALGSAVASTGDIDGDGVSDLLVGSPGANPHGLSKAGSSYLLSGQTGSLIRRFDGLAQDDGFGDSVAGPGDVDGDGVPDILCGASTSIGINNLGGYALLFSGASGLLIQDFFGQGGDFFGTVGSPGDLNGDRLPEFLIGARGADNGGMGFWSGSAWVYSLNPFLYPDSDEFHVLSGPPLVLDIEFPTSEAGAAYIVLASGSGTGPVTLGGLLIPLTQDSTFNRLLSGWNPSILTGGRGTLDLNGRAQASLNGHPALAHAVGRTIYMAVVSYRSATMTGRLSSIARYLTVVP